MVFKFLADSRIKVRHANQKIMEYFGAPYLCSCVHFFEDVMGID